MNEKEQKSSMQTSSNEPKSSGPGGPQLHSLVEIAPDIESILDEKPDSPVEKQMKLMRLKALK